MEPSPATREHVPPEAVGGKFRTMTCGPCNHKLASLVEADLAAWYDQRLLGVRFTKDSIPGGRGAFVNLRTTTEGEFVLTATRADPAIAAMLDAGGEFGIEFCEAEETRYRVALLKHAYIAACLHLGTIPDGEAAAAVRAELLAVRDAPDRDELPASPIAQCLRFGRSYRPADGALFLWASPLSVEASRKEMRCQSNEGSTTETFGRAPFESSWKLVGPFARLLTIWGSMPGHWPTGWHANASPGESASTPTRSTPSGCANWSEKTPSCEWSVMSSSDPWSSG